jgi:hypothetical protein
MAGHKRQRRKEHAHRRKNEYRCITDETPPICGPYAVNEKRPKDGADRYVLEIGCQRRIPQKSKA